jgi:hypothetical protein
VKKKLIPKLYDAEQKLINPENFDINFGSGGPFKSFNYVSTLEYLDMNDENTTLNEEQKEYILKFKQSFDVEQ